jgi:hypothetical protein
LSLDRCFFAATARFLNVMVTVFMWVLLEGFLSRQINPPQRQISTKGRNLRQLVKKPFGFLTS